MKAPKEFKQLAPVKHPDYWKVKSAFLEAQAAGVQARTLLANADAKLSQVMTAAGLDPKAKYELKDDAESITLQGVK